MAKFYAVNMQLGAGQGVTFADFQKVKALGFNTVRMGLYWGVMMPNDEFTVNQNVFTTSIGPNGTPGMDTLIDWCGQLGLNIIFQLAWTDTWAPPSWAFQGITSFYDRFERLFTAGSREGTGYINAWSAIAARYHDQMQLVMELCNEPGINSPTSGYPAIYASFMERVIDGVVANESVNHYKLVPMLRATQAWEEVVDQQVDVNRPNVFWTTHRYEPWGDFKAASIPLNDGVHVITAPATGMWNGVSYNFQRWEDGSTNRVRTINLASDMSIQAIYAVPTTTHGLPIMTVIPRAVGTGQHLLSIFTNAGDGIAILIDGLSNVVGAHGYGYDYATGQYGWLTSDSYIYWRIRRCSDKIRSWGKEEINTEFGKESTSLNWELWTRLVMDLNVQFELAGWTWNEYDKFGSSFSVVDSAGNATAVVPILQEYEVAPVQYPLTINSSVSGITVMVDATPHVVPTTINLDEGLHTVEAPATATVGGTPYAFTNWEDGSTNRIKQVYLTSAFTISANYAIVAKTLVITSTVGGTTNPSGSQSYALGTVVPVSAFPSGNYTFTNWVLDGTPYGSSNPVSITMNTDHTLQAVFTQNIIYYTLSAGSNITLNPSGGNYQAGTVVQATANPPTGYRFLNWLLDGANAGSSNPTNITMNANHTLQAVFEQITYLLTVLDPSPNGAGTPTASATPYNIGTQVALTAVPASGYRFDHWIVDGASNTSNPLSVTMNANHTVQAVFALIMYTVTIGASSGGTTSPSAGQHQYVQGEVVALAGIPNTNYVFTNWNINGATVTANPYEITIDRNYTVQVTFTYVPPQVQFTLAISSTSGGSTNPSGTRLYNEGTDVVIVANPATGYYLDHWLLDNVNIGSTNPYTITMNANHALQAVFALIPKWSLTVTGGTPTSATGYVGDFVTITAQIPQGYRFIGWILDSGIPYTENPLTLQINDTSSHTLVANFELIPTTITLAVTAGVGGSVSPSGQLTLTIGQSYQFNASEGTGYDFDHWDLNGESKGSTPSIIMVTTASMDKQVLTALFRTEPIPQITMTITVTGNGTTDIAPGQQTFNVGETVTITAIPQAEAVFFNWQLDGSDYSTDNPLHLTITADMNGKTLTANFATPIQAGFPWWSLAIAVPTAIVGTYVLKGDNKKRRYNKPVTRKVSRRKPRR